MTIPSNIRELAEMLHTICCRMNHTDQCAWYYDNCVGGDIHKQYEAYAQKLVDQFGFDTTRDMMVKIRRIQFGDRVDEI